MTRKKALAVLLLPVVLLLLASLIRTIENDLSDDDASFYGGFVQLCFSSWPSKLSLDRHSWWFAVGVSSRIVLVFGSFVGIVAILESMIRQKRLPMRYMDLMRLRDNTIRDYFLKEVPVSDEDKKKYFDLFEKAKQQADQDLIVQLRGLFGKEADGIMRRMQQTGSANI
jgi:hypothetical protein